MASKTVDDALWHEFHQVVNMSPQTLDEWLRIAPSDPDWEQFPDPAGIWTGHRVLGILRKLRLQLDDDDVRVMRKVVDQVRAERRAAAQPTSGYGIRHRRLLSIGHDPLKAA